jgi:hypothetical protein
MAPHGNRDAEVESLGDLDLLLASGRPLTGLRLQDLDLTAYESQLLQRTDLEGLVVLGGRLPPALDAHLRAHHALVFPTDPGAPVDPYRATLYQPHELYAGLDEQGTSPLPTTSPTSGPGTWPCSATLWPPCFAPSTTTP